jgi:hypothetical protein
LSRREPLDEVLANAPKVHGARPAYPVGTGGSQDGEGSTPIGFTMSASYEPGIDQPVYQARQPAPAESNPIRKLSHPKPALARRAQLEEDVVLGQRHPFLGYQLGLEAS